METAQELDREIASLERQIAAHRARPRRVGTTYVCPQTGDRVTLLARCRVPCERQDERRAQRPAPRRYVVVDRCAADTDEGAAVISGWLRELAARVTMAIGSPTPCHQSSLSPYPASLN
jgi:hypothetical protein